MGFGNKIPLWMFGLLYQFGWQERLHEQKQRIPIREGWDALLQMVGVADECEKCADYISVFFNHFL